MCVWLNYALLHMRCVRDLRAGAVPGAVLGNRIKRAENTDPATPSLQILLRGGLGGSAVVGGEEASRLSREASSALVAVGQRYLTRM
jgi:hypothetical protein